MTQPKVLPQAEADGEWLSALLDGELDDDEAARALRRLDQEPEARARWSAYCLIGDALRGDVLAQPRLGESLRAALAAEPTVLAPPPKRERKSPALWLAAAAAVGGITWTLWQAAPPEQPSPPLASRPLAPALANEQMQAYLAAHQDYAQAVISSSDMRYTTVSLETSR